ncbi:helix-turn-helix domain-containing protein [Paraburkholderia acidisoli]|uniref:Helix-turn-helix domain-containing protein n=1 Tax=Paraburkholderia acidisoli TaxID=2571748 RepID=A0A7Z2JGT8_9BURK|nr:AraC family transcriptional regulator [Paraburkholderia acidisoli]QGZ64972.1 helix-turn-helix domain-containing protein [Paraburkholderia acidisoli]
MITENRTLRAPASSAPVDRLGCALDRLALSQQLDVGELRFHRKHAQHGAFGKVETPAEDRGFLIGVSLKGGHQRRILRGPDAATHEFAEHAMYIRDFATDYRAELAGSFDFVLTEVPRAWLERLGADVSRHRVQGIAARTGERDDVLGHLVRALLPAFDAPGAHDKLFVEQMGVAIGLHLVSRYGGTSLRSAPRRAELSRWQEARAKELLLGGASTAVSIEAIAAECKLSPSYFIRAFRGSTGQTPYQWQLAQRIARAQHLLTRSAYSLVEVASVCGFTDQTHFTRVFSKAVGVAPGAWRKQNT